MSIGKNLQVIDPITPGRDLTAYIASVNSIAVLTPEHELDGSAADGWLRLSVQLPRIAAVGEIDIELGDTAVNLTTAEGLYELRLPLPTPVDSDAAKCKWDKKRRVLTVTMPTTAPAADVS